MNLIEQLGGYSAAKNWLDKNEIDVKHGYMEKYQRELLEHRRQHNIFEVGDKVLEVGDDCERTILIVNSITNKMMVCVNDGLDASYVLSKKYAPSFYVRHATDLEISAGHRL